MELLERRIRNGPALLPSFSLSAPSHTLRHKAPHHVRRLLLLVGGGVGVGPQGEARVEVAQHLAHCLDVYAVLEHQRGRGMPHVVKTDVLQARALQDILMEPVDGVRVVHPSGHG